MSVLRIYQNPIAINALRNLKVTGSMISKSLERLSSGLRINRAADDAAGLSISEKLRAQIRGLNRASMNALDGVSLIQTAEGALNEVHAILQRMRELAVQAANGIYTADDRAALQLEISQLTDEINRIAASTEFNTKKLLDGTMGALVSTDDFSKVQTAVIGNVGSGGNFVMKAAAKSTGQLQVQKTDVFATQQSEDRVGKVNYLHTWRADATVTTSGMDGVGNTGIQQIEVSVAGGAAIFSTNATDIGIFRLDGTGVNFSLAQSTDSAVNVFQAQEITLGVDKLLFTTQDNVNGVLIHSLVLSAGNTATFDALEASIYAVLDNDGGTALIGAAADVSFVNATGDLHIQLTAANNAQLLNVEFVDVDGSGSEYYMSFGAGAGASSFASNIFVNAIVYDFANRGQTDLGIINASNNSTYQIGTAVGAATDTGVIDIRFDTRFDWSSVNGVVQQDTIKWERYTGGNSFQEYGHTWQEGPAAGNGTFFVSAISMRTYSIYEFNNEKYTSLVAQGWDQNLAVQASRGDRLSSTTGALVFSVTEAFSGAAGSPLENVHFTVDGILQAGETATFNLSTNNVLTADQMTTLASINRFHDFGVFLGRNNVELTLFIRGTANSAKIILSKNDTLEDLANKISLAIWNPDGSGVVNSGIINGQAPPDLVHVNTIGVAKGTISIVTPVPGAELVLAGNEAMLNALSLFEVRETQAPMYSVTAFNLEKGQSVGSMLTDTNEITGLLPGLRIFFDNTLGLSLDPEPPTSMNGGGANVLNNFAYLLPIERPQISLSGAVESFFIHVAPRGFDLQIGANQGQLIQGFIADHSARSLAVEGLLITDSKLAAQAISTLDVALSRVSDMRSRLGAIQNRLESTIRNLDIAAENLTSAESRIRDADIAQETLFMTRNQILLQAGVAALAQANQLPQAVLQLLR
jgi:flagellin-like hook-associated protein FlgL